MVNLAPTIVLEESTPYLDKDGLWKRIITDLFEPFVLFFAPDLYEQLDWSKEPNSLEQEFHRAVPKKKGTKYTDKLMKVYLKDGNEQWILAHIEVQGYKDDHFSERMFQYFYRIFDKFNQKIYAIALLADPDHFFKPTIYEYHFHGTDLTYSYNTYKLLEQDEEELLQSDNPFAYAVLAGIYMLKSRKNASKRYQFKRRLLELLLQDPQKRSQEYIQPLLYFIDYLLEVPEEMTRELQEEIGPMIGKEASYMERAMYPDPPTLKPFIDEWRQEGKAEGIAEGTKKIAMSMLKKGYSAKEIMELTNLTEKELDELKKQI